MPRRTRSSGRRKGFKPSPPHATRWTLYRNKDKSLGVAAPGGVIAGVVIGEAATFEGVAALAADHRRDGEVPSLGRSPAVRPPHYAKKIHAPRPPKTTFGCGHPRTPENSYGHQERTTVCRTCTLARARRWQKNNSERFHEKNRGYKRLARLRRRLAELLFEDLQSLAAADGIDIGTPEPTGPERRVS